MKKLSNTDPVDTGRPGRLLNVLCTFNLRPVSTGEADLKKALLIKKACTSSLAKFPVSHHYAFFRDKYVSKNFAITFEKISHKKVLLYDSCLVEPQTFSLNLGTKTFS